MNRDEAMKLAAIGLSQLEEALKAGKSESLESWLSLLSRFHHYSFRNCLLISVQRPESTFVAGFHRWKELGRYVKKGETGIAILAPLVYRRKAENDDEDGKPKSLRGFKAVHVFDVSQTDGKELPQFSRVSGEPGELLTRLEGVVRKRGITLEYGTPGGGTLGVCTDGKIVVRPDLGAAETFSVLCHEVAHSILHQGEAQAKA